MEICSLWTNEGHLDVDDVLALPLFSTTLNISTIDNNWCGPENFRALNRLVHSASLLQQYLNRLGHSAITSPLWRSSQDRLR